MNRLPVENRLTNAIMDIKQAAAAEATAVAAAYTFSLLEKYATSATDCQHYAQQQSDMLAIADQWRKVKVNALARLRLGSRRKKPAQPKLGGLQW